MMQPAPPGRLEGRMAGGLSVEGQGAEDSADRTMLRVKGRQPQGHTPDGGTQVVNSSGNNSRVCGGDVLRGGEEDGRLTNPTSSQGWETEARDPQRALRKEGLGARLSLQPASLCRSRLWDPGSDIDRALPKDPQGLASQWESSSCLRWAGGPLLPCTVIFS